MSFGAAERKIGGAAANQAGRNPENTIFGAKRLIGLTIDDENLKGDQALMPFKIVEGKNKKPMIEVKVGKETK